MKKTTIIFLVSLAILLISGGYTIKSIQLKQNCTGYLKRAANATTTETALEEIKKATAYLESKDLTKGFTSAIYETPSENIGYWYDNLKDAEKELSQVNDKTTSLEKSNLLLKLRENLLQSGKNGDSVIYPTGLAVYPNNLLVGTFLILSILSLVVLSCVYTSGYND